jgi:protein subunit release factor B
MKLDMEKILKESKISFFRAGGPGGQHRNKTETGVIIKHLPTGITASASERRSQSQNRDVAEERLLAKLQKHYRKKKQRKKTTIPRSVREDILKQKAMQSEKKRMRAKITETDG